MTKQWKMICKVKDIPPNGTRLVPRGLAWQELPSVALFRSGDDQVVAVLDSMPEDGRARQYSVRIDDEKIYLDLDELSAPASKAEAALAGSHGVATRILAFS